MTINEVKVPQISVIMKDKLLVWAVNHGPKTVNIKKQYGICQGCACKPIFSLLLGDIMVVQVVTCC